MSDQLVREILIGAGVRFHKHSVSVARVRFTGVYITDANQLIGTYANLERFRKSEIAYRGWQIHHIVEKVDLDRLGVQALFPPSDDQICVLLPERAHIGRINSILRHENPIKLSATAAELVKAYSSAYDLIGDYSGGGERQIRQELLAIVKQVFKRAGLRLA